MKYANIPSFEPLPHVRDQALTGSYRWQDSTIRWVLEYSEVADFSNLAPLNLQLPLFDKRTYISSSGRDLENDFILDPRGKVRGGRFVYTKSTPVDEFTFPQSRQLENGVDYYFKNYKVRDGCVSPPLDMHTPFLPRSHAHCVLRKHP